MEPYEHSDTMIKKVKWIEQKVIENHEAFVSAQVSLSREEATLDEINMFFGSCSEKDRITSGVFERV